jgi:hypothetical protein
MNYSSSISLSYISYCFVYNFCIYVHENYTPIVFLSCKSVRFWNQLMIAQETVDMLNCDPLSISLSCHFCKSVVYYENSK